jgi:ribosome-associated toxin RatA of RatAB toxin-antitoxin module
MEFVDSRLFDAPPAAVWTVITDFDRYAEVAPNLSRVDVLDGDGEGMHRACTDTDGRTWTETCTVWEPEHRYAVEVHVAESPFHRRLFHTFSGEWAMEPRDEGVLVTMTFSFLPRYGPLGWLLGRLLEREARRLTTPIFDGWARELDAPPKPPVTN